MPGYPGVPSLQTVTDKLASIAPAVGNVAGYYVWLVDIATGISYGPSAKTDSGGNWSTPSTVPPGFYDTFYAAEAVTGVAPTTWTTAGVKGYLVALNPVTSVTSLGWYNVKDAAYLAKGDAVDDANCSIGTGTATLSSTSSVGPWKSTDATKLIAVPGAGVAGVSLVTTILSFQDSKHITLAASAGTTVSGVRARWGTNDTIAIQAALTAAGAAAGGEVFFPPGTYFINAGLTFTGSVAIRGAATEGASVIQAMGLAVGILAPSAPGTRIYNVAISDIELDNTDRLFVGGIGLDLTNVSQSSYQRVICQNVETGVKIAEQGGSPGAYFNTFIDVVASTVSTGYSIGSNENRFHASRVNDFLSFGWNLLVGGPNAATLFGCSAESAANNATAVKTAGAGFRIFGLRLDNAGGATGTTGVQTTAAATQTLIWGLYVGAGIVTLVNDAAADTLYFSAHQAASGSIGLGTGNPATELEVRRAVAQNWASNQWNGGGGTTPLGAITVTNTQAGGNDAAYLLRMATTTGVLKTAGAIDVTGVSSWTDGNVLSQIADMLFILQDGTGNLAARLTLTAWGHLRTNAAGPVTTSALGTNVSTAVGSGDDVKGTITITAGGTLITAPIKICTVAFAKAYTNVPRVIPTNATTGAADGTHSLTVYATAAVTMNGFDLWAISGNINAAAVVKADFHVLE